MWPKLLLLLAIFSFVAIPFTIWLAVLLIPKRIFRIQTDVRFEAPFISGICRYKLSAKVKTFEFVKGEEALVNECKEVFKVRKSDCPDPMGFFVERIDKMIHQERLAIIERWRHEQSDVTQAGLKGPRLAIDRRYRKQLTTQVKELAQ